MSSPGKSDIDDDNVCDTLPNLTAKAADLPHHRNLLPSFEDVARPRGVASLVPRARRRRSFNWQRALPSYVDARFISVAITFQIEPRIMVK